MTNDWFPKPTGTPLRGGPVVRWGVLGPGTIAGDFTTAIHRHSDQRVVAVASRSAERAAKFAAAHGIARPYGSYEELLDDPTVDVVYIATPHSEHHRLALLALASGKHALIEKPVALSASQAQDIADAAATTGRLAAEAMWTAYLPQFDVLRQVIDRGDLGDILLATADVGWAAGPGAPAQKLAFSDGGGAALDMGVYGYWFAHFAIGAANEVCALGSTSATGVDDQTVVGLRGSSGRHASVTTSMAVTNSGLGSISGTNGRANFLDAFVFPASFVVHTDGARHEWRDTSGLTFRDGLAWQACAVAQFIHDGAEASPIHSLHDSVQVLRVIDEVRRQIADGRSSRASVPNETEPAR